MSVVSDPLPAASVGGDSGVRRRYASTFSMCKACAVACHNGHEVIEYTVSPAVTCHLGHPMNFVIGQLPPNVNADSSPMCGRCYTRADFIGTGAYRCTQCTSSSANLCTRCASQLRPSFGCKCGHAGVQCCWQEEKQTFDRSKALTFVSDTLSDRKFCDSFRGTWDSLLESTAAVLDAGNAFATGVGGTSKSADIGTGGGRKSARKRRADSDSDGSGSDRRGSGSDSDADASRDSKSVTNTKSWGARITATGVRAHIEAARNPAPVNADAAGRKGQGKQPQEKPVPGSPNTPARSIADSTSSPKIPSSPAATDKSDSKALTPVIPPSPAYLPKAVPTTDLPSQLLQLIERDGPFS